MGKEDGGEEKGREKSWNQAWDKLEYMQAQCFGIGFYVKFLKSM